MNRDFTAPAAPYEASSAVIRCKLAPGVLAGWVPSRFLIESAMTIPSRDEIEIQVETAEKLGYTPSRRWLSAAGARLPVSVRVAQSGLVSDGAALFSITSDDRNVLRDAIDWLSLSTVTQATVNALCDAREGARRASTRAGEQNALLLSATSCVMMTRDAQQEFAASLVFDQRPKTLLGAVATQSVHGRIVTFGSSLAARETAAARVSATSHTAYWLTSTEREFERVLAETDCVPVVPQHRDVTCVLKHASKNASSKLLHVGKKYAFYASSPSEAKQSFSALASFGVALSECSAVLDFACKPMLLQLDAGSEKDTDKLVELSEIAQLNHATATSLLFN